MTKEILKKVEEIFFAKLQLNTTFGRNQIKELYNQSVAEALLEFI